MKHYTHAWLAMMAMKRIEFANIPEKQREDAKALIDWFKNYRDLVLQGAWYPDSVFKDMSNSHIAKYSPYDKYVESQGAGVDAQLAKDAGKKAKQNPKIRIDSEFRKMPPSLKMFERGKKSPLYKSKYILFKRHNLCDRCESFTESLIDSFKILTMENPGAPVVPSNNHIAMRFFILSHYIADGHMPLHCDARSFYKSNQVHAFIEEEWDNQVQASYSIDKYNDRFFYDKNGYPAFKDDVEPTPLVKYVEREAREREFIWAWGSDNNNTWDYMSGITQYSYLMAYDLVPADREPAKISTASYKQTEAYKEHFEEYSRIILSDAVESIAKIWLHAWCRYRSWFREHELACLKEKLNAAGDAFAKADKIMETYPPLMEAKQAEIEKAEADLQVKQADLDEAIAQNKSTTKKTAVRDKAAQRLEKLRDDLQRLESEYDRTDFNYETIEAVYVATQLEVMSKEEEIKRLNS